MNPADRLIVALDFGAIDASHIAGMLNNEAGVGFFKVGAAALMNDYGTELTRDIARMGADLFLDLKIYDTRDTVDRVVRTAFNDLGARFVTVHATPSVMEAAMRAKPADPRCEVLAVGHLTDGPIEVPHDQFLPRLEVCDGIVCKPSLARAVREHWPRFHDKTLVCPGVRTGDLVERMLTANNHSVPSSPIDAIRAGADFLVIGRPIYLAPDPAASARAIIDEIDAAQRS